MTIADSHGFFLIQQKSDLLAHFKQFCQYVETHFKRQVKVVRTDNAKELFEGDTLQFYQEKGILHESSCVGTPKQNGVVERKHRHLLEVTRALYFQSKVPISFWSDCLQSAVHIINKMPMAILNKATPYEKMFGEKPSHNMLKAFGCLSFASTLKRNRTKLDPKANPMCVYWVCPREKGIQIIRLKYKKGVYLKGYSIL